MQTKEALTGFLKHCEERGLAPVTRQTYNGYLRHFADELPELPTDMKAIEKFLQKRKETPAHRGQMFKYIQAFYTYLKEEEGLEVPVLSKGKVGRPRKAKLVINPASTELEGSPPTEMGKLVKGGPYVSTSISISTDDAVTWFITARKHEGCTERTVENYGYFFKPFMRKFPILPLTLEPIEEFLGEVQGSRYTRWTYARCIKALYHFLEKRKRIPRDLWEWSSYKPARQVRRILSAEELRGLFPYTQDFREKAILSLLIDAKIRASELCTLTRDRVFPEYITVTGKVGERNVPINPVIYNMLVQLAPSGLLFPMHGKPMNREYLRKILRRLMLRAGLNGKKLGPHILRHSASVQHIMFGGDLMSLKEELGHTQVSTTQIYAELAFPQVKEQHTKVDVLGKIAMQSTFERAKCYGCGKEIVLEMAKLKDTKCPGCGQVGMWYLPNHQGGGEE